MDVLTRQNEVDILNDNDFSLKQIFVSSGNNKAITESQHFVPCDTVKSESLAEMALLKNAEFRPKKIDQNHYNEESHLTFQWQRIQNTIGNCR
jgi:hypothetical protein